MGSWRLMGGGGGGRWWWLVLVWRRVVVAALAAVAVAVAVEAAFGSTEPTGEGRARARAEGIAGQLLARAKEEGTVREDAEVGDVVMIVCGLAAVIRYDAGDWRRYVRCVCGAAVLRVSGLRS
ncbi:hypothetical protein ACH4Q6_14005 [Streptomyces lydicus]|uniref:SbtR family transcriptional regulator n=1 Tax=Streptomyces lydicus TaxID=47763 RepID=UPI003798400B